ncbi:MAG: HWE histidine kinase domain-containing protein [Pseudolabrys sp.]|nr:HWE histidine kinase domain-containing protein [Pseudolabrys sp.]
MDKPRGFLESEFERLVATRDDVAADGNVVPFPDSPRPEPTLRERERRFHSLLNALPAAVYTTDTDGHVNYYNDAAAELWGSRPPLGKLAWCGSPRLLWPDGTPLPHDQSPMAIAVKENRAVRGFEGCTERPDGTCVPWLAYPTPLHDEAGQLVGAVNMLVDITERKRIEEQQSLMVRELHHRVKNTLATVQAIMGSTARSSETIEDFKTALIARIGSLARTHRLLTDDGPTVSFGDILKNELDAFDDGSEGRITLTGPDVLLSSQLAVSLGMAVHELTTNAAKFGALSIYGGKVDVTWNVAIEKSRRTLTFDWVESSGPAVSEPARHGFGSRLLDFVLPGQIQAKATVDYAREGVRIHCVVPLPAEPEADSADDTGCPPR